MKILSFSSGLYANFMYDNTLALNSVGVDCSCLKMKKHIFSYEHEAKIADKEEIFEAMKQADLIQIFHSHIPLLKLAEGLNKKIVVWHTGSAYRRNPQMNNEAFNPSVEFCFTDQCEFMMLGAKGIKYVATAVDTDKIKDSEKLITLPYKIAHYPSNAEVKGSKTINRLMNGIENYIFSSEKVPHPKQLERIAECDIYIELYQPVLEGKPYGCYGVTAFEAAALGKVVVTDNIFPNVYPDTYGCKLPFITPHSENNFTERINELLTMSRADLASLGKQTRDWVVKNHSYQATGERLTKLFF